MRLFEWSEYVIWLMRTKFKSYLAVIAVYLSIAGLVTFSLFILEEAFQTAMFGTWPAQDAQRWDIVLDGTDIMDDCTWWMTTVNYSVGWIQPLAFISYRAYAKSANFYTRSLRSKVMVNQPELLLGRTIKMRFIVKEARKHESNYVMSNGRIKYTSDKKLSGVLDIEGVLTKTGVGYEIIGVHGMSVRE